MEGWISLHRKIMDNEMWLGEKFTRAQAWIDLLLLANHQNHSILVRGIDIDLKAGDLFWSQDALAKRWRWSRKKVKHFLNLLRTWGQIEYKVYNRIGITSIVNWHKYQTEDTTKDTTKDRQKIDKGYYNNNDNKDNNKDIITPVGTGGYEKFIETFNRITNRKFTARDKKARTQFLIRLKEGWKIEEIEGAIRSCMSDKFHKESGFKYLTPEFITRSDKLEKYAALSSPSSGLSPRSVEEMRKAING